jgi:hypothetical protein
LHNSTAGDENQHVVKTDKAHLPEKSRCEHDLEFTAPGIVFQ